MKAALIIPTRNGEELVRRLLKSISIQTHSCDVFVVDSSSTDKTIQVASAFGASVSIIPVSEFNHGATRQKMVDANPDYDICVFMTQDAYLADSDALERLVAPFVDGEVGAVCGRQLPHKDANKLAEHARLFNYPPESRVKSMADAPELGIKTPFISNSFAAYRREALLGVGGFPSAVILSEDMWVAAKMLLAGWKVAYAGDARCYHSHNYTLLQEFRRYFDQGVFHARESWIRASFGGAGGEGLRYVKSELQFLGARRFYLWPSSLLRNALKLMGYKLGQQESRLPLWLKRGLSMHRGFWQV
ncbi:glycosyltransferase family 2 protein [Thioalkalivibrio sulfidiphilus]|uniref:glycosyltransferase family 2 protein n=1 Tax=Thioalkalivibrio sulfidiphilus TaxID=1033854 RepID=UPI003B2CDD8B